METKIKNLRQQIKEAFSFEVKEDDPERKIMINNIKHVKDLAKAQGNEVIEGMCNNVLRFQKVTKAESYCIARLAIEEDILRKGITGFYFSNF